MALILSCMSCSACKGLNWKPALGLILNVACWLTDCVCVCACVGEHVHIVLISVQTLFRCQLCKVFRMSKVICSAHVSTQAILPSPLLPVTTAEFSSIFFMYLSGVQ